MVFPPVFAQISALVRSPEKLPKHPNLKTVKGDVSNASDVLNIVKGADVVVSCLGNVKGVLIMEKSYSRKLVMPPISAITNFRL